MEFAAPGVQSRDRAWRRYYFVLHGTYLRVYKHDIHKIPPKETSGMAIPVVQEEELKNLHVHPPGERRDSMNHANRVNRRGSGTDSSSVREGATGRDGSNNRRASHSSNCAPGPPVATGTTEKDVFLFQPQHDQGTKQPRRNSSTVPPPAPSSGINARENIASHLPFAGNSLVREYTLQNSESGLAADYVKKRNVVRVRAEGEQFLLQTESAREVVDWIEVSCSLSPFCCLTLDHPC